MTDEATNTEGDYTKGEWWINHVSPWSMVQSGEKVLIYFRYGESIPDEECLANARLIASAAQLKAENEALHQQLKDSLLLYNNQTRTIEQLQEANRELIEAFARLKLVYDNKEDLAGVVSKEMIAKHSKL